MAVYHLSAKIISRKSGRPATAAERTGEIHDYTRKGVVEFAADIVLPDNAPTWAYSAGRTVERRRACREARGRMRGAGSTKCGPCPPSYRPRNGGDERNHHAHLLRITRKFEADGLGAKLDTEKALPGSRRI